MTNENRARGSKNAKQAGREITVPQQEVLTLTGSLTAEQLQRFCGTDLGNLKTLSEGFLSAPLFIGKNKYGSVVSVDQRELDKRYGRDSGLKARLTGVCFALENLVIHGATLNDINIEQAIDDALKVQNEAPNNIAVISRNGKKLDNQNIAIPDLEDSVVFESFVKHTICPEDLSVPPSQTLFFLSSGKTIYSRLIGENNAFLKDIQKKVGGVKITTNGESSPKIIITGDVEKIEEARNKIVTFANLIAEYGYKKKEHLKQTLACVLGERKMDQLPSPKKSSGKDGGKLGFSLATMTVNMRIAPDSINQQNYVDNIENDENDIVMAQGPAGTGKTLLVLQTAMRKIRDHYNGVEGENFGKLILSIPFVNVGGKDMGALPGDLDQKTKIWASTFYNHLVRILAPLDSEGNLDLVGGTIALDELKKAGIIEVMPLEIMRGKSIAGAIVILDEAENATDKQMTTFLTRAESTTRMIVIGDLEQSDRGKDNKPKGEPFLAYDNVRVKDGIAYIQNNERWVKLGHHKDIGHFKMKANEDKIEKIYPHNGFAEALLMYTGYPGIACTSLDHTDIRRSRVGRAILVLRAAARIVGDDEQGLAPHGYGILCPKTVLAKQDEVDAYAYNDWMNARVPTTNRPVSPQQLTLQ